ncbi:hypothetical protein STCU_11485 [Strigomonas culicis]|uniref:Uncharacterized protein n=1 Tax=Strigomonas culicis TaxID=28005 RepID=S9TDU1_9TRYP|nr:hypothetical protein STCU_11485 [Strigomonas culicis]|eukprot:EPY16192.1 hypothetical protein STCU_11485 [Strigomonas culicis]
MEYTGVPVRITEDIFQIYAWTLDRAVFERKRGAIAGAADSDDDDRDPSSLLWRSPACLYDCTLQRARELPSYSIPKAVQRLREMGGAAARAQPPPTPVMCISCSEVELVFEEPPANSKIAYTINGSEPALFDVDPPACAAPLRPAGTGVTMTRTTTTRAACRRPPPHRVAARRSAATRTGSRPFCTTRASASRCRCSQRRRRT